MLLAFLTVLNIIFACVYVATGQYGHALLNGAAAAFGLWAMRN